jgi:hypothetical protein
MPLLERPLAALYDRLMSSSEQRWLGEARRQLLSGLAGRVLEIGAGTGANFQHYSALLNPASTSSNGLVPK